MKRGCIDKLQNLYFANALINEKGSEWDYIKNRLNNILNVLGKYCNNEALNDDEIIEKKSLGFLDSVKNNDIINANNILLDMEIFIKKQSNRYILNETFKFFRFFISLALIITSLIILLSSEINIYQWLLNLFLLGISIGFATLISYSSIQLPLFLVSFLETINVYLSDNLPLLFSQVLITIISLLSFLLNRKFMAPKFST